MKEIVGFLYACETRLKIYQVHPLTRSYYLFVARAPVRLRWKYEICFLVILFYSSTLELRRPQLQTLLSRYKKDTIVRERVILLDETPWLFSSDFTSGTGRQTPTRRTAERLARINPARPRGIFGAVSEDGDEETTVRDTREVRIA